MLTALLAALPAGFGVAAWIYLISLRGGFWRADVALHSATYREHGWPEVAVVIPARNEAETIAQVLEAHLRTVYRGPVHVILVDDGSQDGTGAIARNLAARAPRPLTVVDAPPLPEGWTGKLWALEIGLAVQRELAPAAEWVLLTDADIVHANDTLTRLVDHASDNRLALASLMARLDDRGLWGRLLIPAFIFFFQKLYPFSWVNSPAHTTAAAAGGCVLIRRTVLEEIGGMAAIRGALIDDVTLATTVKLGPPRRRIWLGLSRNAVVSLRDNRSLWSIWSMVSRTAFNQLRHSTGRLIGTVLGMAVIYLAGPLALLSFPLHGAPGAALLGATAWGLAARAYWPTVRLYERPMTDTLWLPIAAALYTLMTAHSAVRHWTGRGSAWKGRTYPA
ncbi:MAG: glycosyltransferase [Pikeienuella sp.]